MIACRIVYTVPDLPPFSNHSPPSNAKTIEQIIKFGFVISRRNFILNDEIVIPYSGLNAPSRTGKINGISQQVWIGNNGIGVAEIYKLLQQLVCLHTHV